MSTQELTLEQQVAFFKAENAKLIAERDKPKAVGGMKITEKGGLSVYGLGRFPVTLYKSQWRALLGQADVISKFIEANDSKLAEKAAK